MLRQASLVTHHESRLARAWPDIQLFLEQPRHLAGFGMTPRSFLAVDHKVVRQHLEPTAAGRHQLQCANRRGKKVEQFARQTEGAGGVVSHHAVFDAEIELFHVASFVRCPHETSGSHDQTPPFLRADVAPTRNANAQQGVDGK